MTQRRSSGSTDAPAVASPASFPSGPAVCGSEPKQPAPPADPAMYAQFEQDCVKWQNERAAWHWRLVANPARGHRRMTILTPIRGGSVPSKQGGFVAAYLIAAIALFSLMAWAASQMIDANAQLRWISMTADLIYDQTQLTRKVVIECGTDLPYQYEQRCAVAFLLQEIPRQ